MRMVMGIKKIKAIFTKALKSNNSPHKLALSFAIGQYVAFSPFPGGHTVIMFGAQWLFELNFPVLFLSTSFNNPWTAIPYFFLDYGFGYWFVHKLLGISPFWTISLEKIFGSGSICIWSFLAGGNILGIISAVVSYPIMVKVFERMICVYQAKVQ